MRDVVGGVGLSGVGVLLKVYGGRVDLPAVSLDKLGVVLIVIGALEAAYGVFRMTRGAGRGSPAKRR
ncbi:hypothetical protein GCM10023205_58390 [Yinghuangia aomiensis]|uniref:Uncharacterized protein n=1 Tax=Yinghuangia aomiensis TaxID=676205 RepID=A0ABP9HXE2_9ACTN